MNWPTDDLRWWALVRTASLPGGFEAMILLRACNIVRNERKYTVNFYEIGLRLCQSRLLFVSRNSRPRKMNVSGKRMYWIWYENMPWYLFPRTSAYSEQCWKWAGADEDNDNLARNSWSMFKTNLVIKPEPRLYWMIVEIVSFILQAMSEGIYVSR